MSVLARFSCRKVWQIAAPVRILGKDVKSFSTQEQVKHEIVCKDNDETVCKDKNTEEQMKEKSSNPNPFVNHRFIYPEFLPDPNPLYRSTIRERLERIDMLARRSVLNIPEFYVGSVLAVTCSEQHASGKVNRFVGICILKEGCGLRASFILRNVVDGDGIEVRYDLYDPTIQKIECLKLEKRLDNELLYLRDAPLEYSTFPFNMEAELIEEGTVPVNDIKVPLKPPPWSEKWERKDLKGIKDLVVSEKRQQRAKAAAKPWEKYDLMKIYRETIPEEEQFEIFSDVNMQLRQLEVKKKILKRQRPLIRPKRSV